MKSVSIGFIVGAFLFGGMVLAQTENRFELNPSNVRWLVKFSDEVSFSRIQQLASQTDAEAFDLGNYADFHLLHFSRRPSAELLDKWRQEEGLIYLERETRYRTTSTATALVLDDPLRKRQWSLRMINLRTAHALNLGSDPSIIIAILDTGIAYTDFKSRKMSPDLAGTIIYSGYDFVSEDDFALDEGDGVIGHGTFMAGIIAQTTLNSFGTSGIAFNAALLPVRIAGRQGKARSSNLARGIRYAVASGATIIMLGIAGPGDSQAVREAIDFATQNNIAIIAPAGNHPQTLYPARYDGVLSVGAVDARGRKAHYSPKSGAVDIYAPGGDMRSGVDENADGFPDGIIAESYLGRNFNDFKPIMIEGTSVAAAHVAGVAALLISHTSFMEPEALYYALIRASRKSNDIMLLDAGKTLLRSIRLIR